MLFSSSSALPLLKISVCFLNAAMIAINYRNDRHSGPQRGNASDEVEGTTEVKANLCISTACRHNSFIGSHLFPFFGESHKSQVYISDWKLELPCSFGCWVHKSPAKEGTEATTDAAVAAVVAVVPALQVTVMHAVASLSCRFPRKQEKCRWPCGISAFGGSICSCAEQIRL